MASPEDRTRCGRRDTTRVMLGRFGWKAGNPTVRQQSAEAMAVDLGLSNAPVLRCLPETAPARKRLCLEAPNGNTPRHGNLEVSAELLDLLTFYTRNLAVPARRKHDDPLVLHGKSLFQSLACGGCHRGPYTTGTVPDQPHLSEQKIWPYTDLLLHDMGEDLADHRPEGVADGREWRTPPLWGIGLHRGRQRPHAVPARRPRAQSGGSDPVAWRRSRSRARRLCCVDQTRSGCASGIPGSLYGQTHLPS